MQPYFNLYSTVKMNFQFLVKKLKNYLLLSQICPCKYNFNNVDEDFLFPRNSRNQIFQIQKSLTQDPSSSSDTEVESARVCLKSLLKT